MRRLFLGRGPSGLRLFLLTTIAAAFLLVPVASASAVTGKIVFSGSGSGTVSGALSEFGSTPGEPSIDCHWDGTEEEIDIGTGPPGPGGASGEPGLEECKTELEAPEGTPALSLGQEADPGSKFVEWNVSAGAFVAEGCTTGHNCTAALPFGSEVVIEAVFEIVPLPIHIVLEGTGSGRVTGREKVGEEEGGVPPIACSNIAGELEEPCDTSPSLIAGFFEGITVEQEAGPDSEFVEWAWEGEGFEGDCPPEGGSVIVGACTVFLNEPGAEITIKAIFDLKTQPLTLTTSGGGSGSFECKELPGGTAAPCTSGDEFPEGAEVEVTPVAGTGSEFVEFNAENGGECAGASCAVEMNALRSVNAKFELKPTLTIDTEAGTGAGSVECEVESVLAPCEASYPNGTEVKLVPSADPGSDFVEFLGDCTGATCELTMDADKTVEVAFDLQPTLTIDTEAGTGSGSVECEVESVLAPCEASYPNGTEVKLVPSADPGSDFVEFLGDCTGATCELTMDADKTVEVAFDLQPTLTIDTEAGTGAGSVECEVESVLAPCETSYPNGTEVKLVPSADPGSDFVEWTGDCSGSGACTVAMTAARSVGAKFDLEPEGGGGGGGTGGGGSTGGGGGTPPPPTPGTAIAKGVAQIKGNKALLKLKCTGGGACEGLAKLFAKLPSSGKKKGKRAEGSAARRHRKAKLVLIGKARFSLAAGASKTLKVKITNGQAKRLLKRGKAVKAKLKGSGLKSRTIKLKPKGKKKSKRHHRRGW